MSIIPEHPDWCDRQHGDSWPVHTLQIGDDLELTRELSFAIEVQQSGNGPVEVVLIEHTPDETSVTTFTPDAAHALRDLLTEALVVLASGVAR